MDTEKEGRSVRQVWVKGVAGGKLGIKEQTLNSSKNSGIKGASYSVRKNAVGKIISFTAKWRSALTPRQPSHGLVQVRVQKQTVHKCCHGEFDQLERVFCIMYGTSLWIVPNRRIRGGAEPPLLKKWWRVTIPGTIFWGSFSSFQLWVWLWPWNKKKQQNVGQGTEQLG